MKNFMGKDGFYWWMGVVEGRDDPLALGRLQIRMFGHHTDNLQELPTSDLPWAMPSLSPNASMSTGTGMIGDWAFGFFMDGESAQFPIILGIVPGIVVDPPSQKGFSSGTHYPLGEPTTSRLYRNQNISNTVIHQRQTNTVKNVPTASGGSWSEPVTPYAAVPPYNRMTETESGHIFEMDDTPGAERVHLAHRSNTFIEMHTDGSQVTKVVGNNYQVYMKDNDVLVKGTCNLTIEGDVNLLVTGKVVGKASEWDITGNIKVNGGITTTGDVVANGISLDNHTHPDPQGGSVGTPQG